jgi:hypothetical protein
MAIGWYIWGSKLGKRSQMSQILYLVRHYQATGQELDAPLTDAGKQQAIALASENPACSPLSH